MEKHKTWECRLRPQGLDFLLAQTVDAASMAMLTEENIQMLADACAKGGVLQGDERQRIEELVDYLRSEHRLQHLLDTPKEDVKCTVLVEAIDQTRKRSAERGEAGLLLPRAAEQLSAVITANLRSAIQSGDRVETYEISSIALEHGVDVDFAMPGLRSFAKEDLAQATTVQQITEGMRLCYSYGVPPGELKPYEEQLRNLKQLPEEWDITEFVRQDDIAMLTRKVDDEDPETLARFQDLLDRTFKRKYTRDRRGGRVPNRLLVKKVTKIMNANIWQDYVQRRLTVQYKDGWMAKKKQPVTGFPKGVHQPITREWYDTYRAQQLDPDLDDGLNEQWLFHGTSKAGADGITSTDFRLNLAGSNAGTLYGRGVYLAECCSKSDEYTTADPDTDLRPLILCRATLGNVLYTDQRTPDTKMLERKCGLGATGITGYRSVLGDREKVSGTFREFIVFDNDLVYPAYVIWYARSSS